MMELLFACLAALLFAATLPGTLELCLLSLGSMFNLYSREKLPEIQVKNLAIVIPAHNEEKNLATTLQSIKKNSPKTHILVIADNCNDSTASIAQKEGCQVLERNDQKNQGKHHALKLGFDTLIERGFEYFLVVDADSLVSANLVQEVQAYFAKGYPAIQVQYTLTPPFETYKSRLLNIAFTAYNVLRPLGRQFWGLSAGIFGNGFGISASTLKKVPFSVISIVEDTAYHMELLKHGIKVHYAPLAQVSAPLPSSKVGFETQRSRWEGGRLRLLLDNFFPLTKLIFKGNYLLIEPLFDLMLLPVGYHVIVLIILFVCGGLYFKLYVLCALIIVLGYTCIAVVLTGDKVKNFIALLWAPFYLLKKIKILPKLLQKSSKKSSWERTQRD